MRIRCTFATLSQPKSTGLRPASFVAALFEFCLNPAIKLLGRSGATSNLVTT